MTENRQSLTPEQQDRLWAELVLIDAYLESGLHEVISPGRPGEWDFAPVAKEVAPFASPTRQFALGSRFAQLACESLS